MAKSALSLADGNGEIQIVQKTSLSDSAGRTTGRAVHFLSSPPALTLSGIVLDLAGALLLLTSRGNALASLLHAAGLAAVGCGGWFLYRAGKQKAAALPAASFSRGPDVSVQVKPDPEKLYHHLKNLLLVIDRSIEEAAQREALPAGSGPATAISRSAENGAPESGVSASAVLSSVPELPDEEIALFPALLEQAYAMEEESCAKEMIAQIRYHLHLHSIEPVDYDPDRENTPAAWFDRMPASKTQTLRPALVRSGSGTGTEGTLICKGLCTIQK